MNFEKSIDVLNSLVLINHDRVQGYQTAFDEIKEGDLKAMFAQFSLHSQDNIKALTAEILSMGGTPTEQSHTTGILHRTWMDLKAAITGNDRVTILNSCEFGDTAAINEYDKALNDNIADLSGKQQTLIIDQHAVIQSDLKKVKALRDLLQVVS